MKPEDIHIGDWQRILLGETPAVFFIEVVIRVFFIYFLLMVSLRLLGKRMAAPLSRNEMIAMVCLAAAIGVPIQTPDKGLLPPVVIALVVVVSGRFIARKAFKDQKFEHLSQDNACILVQDAVLDFGNMKQTRITPERLFAQLRSEGIQHLGEVKRLYIEANGSFTLLRDEQPAPGLSLLPDWDHDFSESQMKSGEQVCRQCGKRQAPEDEAEGHCTHCKSTQWVQAVR